MLFDIEASNLNADFGFTIAVGYKWFGSKKTHVLSIHDTPGFKKNTTNDKWLLKQAQRVLSKAKVLVGHYSGGYDIPFLNTRLAKHKLPTLPPTAHVDTWWQSRHRLKLHSNRLASGSAYFGYPDKTHLSGPTWINGAAGDIPSIKYIVHHCKMDVEVLEKFYRDLRPIITNHPNIALLRGVWGCPVCGNEKIKLSGEILSRTTMWNRYYCKDCGAWSRAPKSGKGVPR